MMSSVRFNQIWSGQTDAAKKVYDSIPILEEWSLKQILADLTRRQISMAHSAIAGCTDSLIRSGLVKEKNGTFQRAPVREPAKKTLADLKGLITKEPDEVLALAQPIPKETTMPTPKIDVVEQVSKLAQALNAMAERHQKEMTELGNLIANAAIDVQEAFETNAADLDRLHQLKKLMQSLGA